MYEIAAALFYKASTEHKPLHYTLSSEWPNWTKWRLGFILTQSFTFEIYLDHKSSDNELQWICNINSYTV